MIPISSRIVLSRVSLIALFGAALAVRLSAQSAPGAPPPAGADVIVIIPDSLADAPRTLSELLRSRVPSASVNRSTGGSDGSAFVSLRDASVVRGDDPLVVIDGIRQVSYRSSLDAFGRRPPSVLDDIVLDEVARVEVLNGPAAAAAYGYDGQRGVIVVTTRVPAGGRPVLRAALTSMADDADPDYSRNLSHVASDGTACPYFREVVGGCTTVATTRYTPLLDDSPFRLGGRVRASLGANGGLGRLGYAAALGAERGAGTLDADATDRTTGSLRLTVPVGPMVRVAFSSFGTAGGATLPLEGSSSLLANGIGGGPLDCSAASPCGADSTSGGYMGGPLSYFRPRGSHRRTAHLGGGLSIDVDPARIISLRTTLTGDFLRDRAWMSDSSSHDYSPSAIASYSRSTAKERNWRVDGAEEATLSLPLGAAVATTRLSAGIHAERSRDETASSAYAILVNGGFLGDPGGVVSSSEARWGGLFRNRIEASLDQRVSWRDRASVGAGLTRTTTRWSAIKQLPVTVDPHADAMYELVGGASPLGMMTSLRLRGAYAVTSGHDERGFTHILNFESPPVYNYDPSPPAWRPDRSAEFEGGFDATFAPASLRLSVTAFRRRETIHDLLPIVAAAEDVNAAALRRVGGGEVVAEMVPLDTPGARLHLRGQLALTHDRVGMSQAPILLDDRLSVGLAIADGESWDAWRNRSYSWADANGDGRIGWDEMVFRDYQAPHGRSRPSNVASVTGDLELAHSFTIGAVLDHVGGFDMYDMTSAMQCLRNVCPALNDPKAPLGDQARAVAIASRATAAGFVVPGDATRLHELSLAWQSSTAATRLGARSVRLTLSAYDLASWTRSKGVHPETDVPAPGDQGALLWSVIEPIPRTVAVRVALTY